MGFYGNITNTTRTNFSFDKIYPNRTVMDNYAESDGIYIGRYVLVEYDSEDTYYYTQLEYNQVNKKYYYASNLNQEFTINESNKNNIFIINGSYHFWDTNTSKFKEIIENTSDVSDYLKNYSFDKAKYPGMNRGYDSTVWVKTYDSNTNKDKYVMIAELNTVVPTFDLAIDPPTSSPQKPFYDKDSNNVYYKLHVQPSWGFRIKPAEKITVSMLKKDGVNTENHSISASMINNNDYSLPSDQKYTLNVNGNNYTNKKAAIYYNKAGFDSKINTKADDSIEDNILIENTGYSHLYENDQLIPDVQEMTISLPSLGNAVAELWNVLYGEGKTNTEDNKKYRNQDYFWEDASAAQCRFGERLGEDYNQTNVNSVAGALNSLHDSLGMIIKPLETLVTEQYNNDGKPDGNPNTFGNVNDDYIYFYNNKYYYKHLLTDISNLKILTKDIYLYSNYPYIRVSVTDKFEPSTEKWYKDLDGNYIKEKSNYYSHIRRYCNNIQLKNPVIITENFDITEFWILDTEGNYTKCDKNHNSSDTNVYTINNIVNYEYLFVPNKYFSISVTEEGIKSYTSLTNYEQITNQENISYYRGDLSELAGEPTKKIPYYIMENGEYVTKYVYTYENLDALENELLSRKVDRNKIIDGFNDNNSTFYKLNKEENKYIKVDKNNYNPGEICYKFDATKRSGENGVQWEKNKYYICINGNYVKDSSDTPRSSVGYYQNIEVSYLTDYITRPYYLFNDENIYYKKDDNGNFIKVDTFEKNFNEDGKEITTNYWIDMSGKFYVINDTTNKYKIGSLWNIKDENVPNEVILGIPQEVYEFKELEGFHIDENTINGLILKINKLLNSNSSTKDSDTVQGAINVLNDYINKFYELTPGNIMFVDNLGRLHSGGFEGDNWINVSTTKENPSLTINHKYNKGTDTTTTADKNTNNGNGTNKGIGDSIKLYTPIIDSNGHIVAKNIETVTLPYNFKTIKTNGVGTNDSSNMTISTSDIIADNTQDEVSINSYNKWIRIASDASNDTITLAHELHDITSTQKDNTDLNGNGDTITIQDLTFDTAGHVTANQNHTYILPYGYKTFEDCEKTKGTSTANSTQATFTFEGDNWIKPVVTKNQLTLSHEKVTKDHITVDNITPAFGSTFSITDLDFDDNGHCVNNGSHTVKIPGLKLANAKNGGNIVTGISYSYNETDNKGNFEESKDYLGNLKLGNYSGPEGIKVQDTDEENSILKSNLTNESTLAEAIKILDERIMNEEKNRKNAIAEIPDASLTEKGLVKLSNSYSGESENLSATEKAVGDFYQEVCSLSTITNIEKSKELIEGEEVQNYYTIKEYIDTKYSDNTNFVYKTAIEGVHAVDPDTGLETEEWDTEPVAEERITISELIQKIVLLEEEIKNLQNKVSELEKESEEEVTE